MTLIADGLELWAPSSGYAFEITRGGLREHAVVRGSNVTIPGKSGQTWMAKVKDHRAVTLRGLVVGDASGATSAPESFKTRMDSLKSVFDPTANPFTITVAAPFEGLDTGQSATIDVEFLRFTIVEDGAFYRYMDIECQSISDPPEWVIGS